MPFSRDTVRIISLVNKALGETEIFADAERIGLGLIKKEIQHRERNIWASVSKEIASLENVAEKIEAAKKFRETAPKKSGLLEAVESLIAFTFLIAGIILLVSSYKNGFLSSVRAIASGSAAVTTLFLVAGLVLVVIKIRQSRFHKLKLAEHEAAVEKNYGLSGLLEQQKLLEKLLEDSLMERGVKTELREIIKDHSAPNYGLVLTVKTAPGLAEVFDPDYEVATSAKAQLRRLIETMAGGSIGIAGPRGVGKSTLLSSFCSGDVPPIGGRRVYSVFTSAPVKYEAREFILHLFSSLCYSVLGTGPGEEIEPDDARNSPESFWPIVHRISRPLLSLFMILGGVLLAVGISVASVQASFPSVAASAQSSSPATPATEISRFVAALGVNAGTFVTSALVCFAVCAVAVIVVAPSSPFRLRMTAQAPEKESKKSQLQERAAARLGPEIARMAFDMLTEVRFQRSYTSGWSGALKIGIGIEPSINNALSIAEKQRSVPELVALFRHFVTLLTAQHAIVIGIDELDKLEDHGSAESFLNEIKAVFGIDHCYYIISVSENAINTFERRGLPFRDSFDSAFDTILYIDYMRLEDAQRLVQRRVLGMEIPFIDLCFCLAGGLPRDLIRVTRDMLGCPSVESGAMGLDQVAGCLILKDVAAKLRAVTSSLVAAQNEPNAGALMAAIQVIAESVSSPSEFLRARRLVARPNRPFSVGTDQSEEEASRAATSTAERVIRWELYAYLYFAGTLLELFSGSLSAPRIVELETTGVIMRIARVRQKFATSTQLAVAELDLLRPALGLSPDANAGICPRTRFAGGVWLTQTAGNAQDHV